MLMESSSLDSLLLLGDSESSAFETHIKRLISKTEAKISLIDSQIHDLVREREREQGTLARLRAKVAPIRKVPAELLSQIFSQVVSDGDEWPDSDSPREVVLHLTHVSGRWRQIAHSTPRLWTFLDIKGDEEKKFSDQYIAMMQTWLARSAPIKIAIRIRCRAPGTDAVLQSLFPSVRRWKSLELECNALAALSLAGLPERSLEMLETVNIMFLGIELPTIKTFLSAPCLQKVTLRAEGTGHEWPIIQSRTPMPWSQLTLIEFNGLFSSCREILNSCKNVVEATFTAAVRRWDAQFPELLETILPRLETLRIKFDDDCSNHPLDSARFFQPFTMPALKNLDLRFFGQWVTLSRETFTEFQLRSPGIEQFKMVGSPMSSDDLFVFLQHAVALRKLEIKDCYDCLRENVFNALQYHEGDILPLTASLEELLLDEHWEIACVETMIRSRWWDEELLGTMAPPKVARWKKVRIFTIGDKKLKEVFSKDFEDWVEVSKRQGLNFAVKPQSFHVPF